MQQPINYFNAGAWPDVSNDGYPDPIGICPVCTRIIYEGDPHRLLKDREVAVCEGCAEAYGEGR